MTFYPLILFVHVTAVLALGAALSVEILSLYQMRTATTLTEVRRSIQLVPGLPVLTAGSALVIFLSGIYLTLRMSAFESAWPKVTIGALLLLAPFGALTGKRMRAIRQLSADAKAIDSEVMSRLQDPLLKVSLAIRTAVFLGIVMLMSAKPEFWQSTIIVGTAIVLGLLSSLLGWRRAGSSPLPGTRLGD